MKCIITQIRNKKTKIREIKNQFEWWFMIFKLFYFFFSLHIIILLYVIPSFTIILLDSFESILIMYKNVIMSHRTTIIKLKLVIFKTFFLSKIININALYILVQFDHQSCCFFWNRSNGDLWIVEHFLILQIFCNEYQWLTNEK